MRLLPYGDRALLVEPDDPSTVLALAARAGDEVGVDEVVPAATTVLITFADAAAGRRLRDVLPAVAATLAARTGTAPVTGAEITLEVRYDGADLAAVATESGLDVDGVVRAHTAGEYVVAFCGFAPGFAYLTGLDPALHLPRRAEPRTRVPAGSVGIAGEFTGIYPRSSPGGWLLLGTTDATLWDLARTPPALLVPGTRVRFRPS